MRKIISREYGTLKCIKSAFPHNERYKNLLLEQIALSLGRIADMLTELRGYLVQYEPESEEE